jgi:hypothetical protein
MIVWDLEGAEFPHKISYIGDPRLVEELAPEMTDVVDEFFARFRRAGLRVGVTVRPQQFVRGEQVSVRDSAGLLQSKIAYARQRWDATLFYLDSNSGPLSPLEGWRLQRLARTHPGILLIPEHHHPLYWAYSAPYQSLTRGGRGTPPFIRRIYPDAFTILNVADAPDGRAVSTAAAAGDILLFRAWFESSEVRMLYPHGNRTISSSGR